MRKPVSYSIRESTYTDTKKNKFQHRTGCSCNACNPTPFEEVFKKGSTIARQHIKKRIYKDRLLKLNCCDICNISNIWQGQEMPFVLDHINGDRIDNRLENLRLICSNCDSQLPTYKARNKKRYAGHIILKKEEGE